MTRSRFTTEELRDLERHHRQNAQRGNAHFYGNRAELDHLYVERQTNLADMILELIEYRQKEDAC